MGWLVALLMVASTAGARPKIGNQMMIPMELDAFYSADSIETWRSVLGPGMHYHHGIWEDGDQSLE